MGELPELHSTLSADRIESFVKAQQQQRRETTRTFAEGWARAAAFMAADAAWQNHKQANPRPSWRERRKASKEMPRKFADALIGMEIPAGRHAGAKIVASKVIAGTQRWDGLTVSQEADIKLSDGTIKRGGRVQSDPRTGISYNIAKPEDWY